MTTLIQWKQIADTSTNSKIYYKVYGDFKKFFIDNCLMMTVAECQAFKQFGYKLHLRYHSFATELKESQKMIDSLK